MPTTTPTNDRRVMDAKSISPISSPTVKTKSVGVKSPGGSGLGSELSQRRTLSVFVNKAHSREGDFDYTTVTNKNGQ